MDTDAFYTLLSLLFRFRGLGDSHARVFGALVLAKKPLSQKQISQKTGYSLASVSMALDDLLRLGLVKRNKQKGSRAWVYEADPDFVAMFKRYLIQLDQNYVVPLLDVAKKFGVPKLEKSLADLHNYIQKILEVRL